MSSQVQRTTTTTTAAVARVSTTQSMAVVKNCIRLAISTVAFKRGLFPSQAFANKVYAGMSMEVLRPFGKDGELVDEGALQVHDWIEKGAFKALELGYLDRLTFYILDAHPESANASVLESYTFKLDNNNGGEETEIPSINNRRGTNAVRATISSNARKTQSKEEVQAMMQKLIKTLAMLTSSLSPLPDTRWLSVSIAYNANAPLGYEAPDFSPQDPRREPSFAGEPLVIPLGNVETGHQAIEIEFRQVDLEEEEEEKARGYDSDNTENRWTKEKAQLISKARDIITNARARGLDEELALKSSNLADAIPSDVLNELLGKMKLEDSPASKPKTYGRVKRPLQQLQHVDEAKKSRMES